MDIRQVEEFMKCVAESETKTFPFKGKVKVGLDLGTAYIVLAVSYTHLRRCVSIFEIGGSISW